MAAGAASRRPGPYTAAMPSASDRAPAATPRSLSGLLPFLHPYRGRIALALLFLVLAAVSTLLFPMALKSLIDSGLVASDPAERVMALRGHFGLLFAVGAALGLFSALRFYMVTWLGERVTADLRNAVYAHVVRQSPEFFETTATGEVLSRLTTDTTLVQTVVGSSLSMGLLSFTVTGTLQAGSLIIGTLLLSSDLLNRFSFGDGLALGVGGREAEVGQLVVQQKALDHLARAESVLDGGGHGQGIAMGIDDADVRRAVFGLVCHRGMGCAHRPGRAGQGAPAFVRSVPELRPPWR